MDAPSVSNKAETDVISHGDGMNTYLGAGDAKRAIDVMDGIETHTDASSVETDTRTAVNVRRDISKRQTEAHIRNSLYTPDNRTPKPIGQWRKVSVDNGDVYIPLVAPIKPANQMFAFGEVEGGDEAIAPSVECEGAGDGDGDRNGDDNGTMSGGSIDSNRVNATLLAVESQHLRWSRRKQNGHLPVLSWPPIQLVEHLYGAVKRYHRHGRVKFKAVKVNQAEEVEMAYLEPTYIAQPPWNDSKHLQRVIGPCRRCDWIKIESVKVRIERLNDKKTQELEMTHLGQARLAQPLLNASKHCYRPRHQHGRMKIAPVMVKIECLNHKTAQQVKKTYRIRASTAQPPPNDSKRLNGAIGPHCRRDRIKIKSIKVNNVQKVKTTYLGCAQVAQPPGNPPNRPYGVHTTRCQHGRIKIVLTNISRTQMNGSAYLRHVNAIWPKRRPKKEVKRFNKLTLEYRMPGEPWRDDGDHG